MANKSMKRCFLLLVTREIQIKTHWDATINPQEYLKLKISSIPSIGTD